METLDRIRSTMSADMNQSALMVKYDTTNKIAAIDASTGKNITLFPSIAQDGRELRFVRLRNSINAAASPLMESAYGSNIATSDAEILSNYALATTSPFFVVNDDAGLPGFWNVAPVWESNETGLTFAENANPEKLRIWRYILVPHTSNIPASIADGEVYATSSYPTYVINGQTLRRGMLLRQFRNAGSSLWQTVGLPLSDSVVFDEANDENKANLPCFIFATAYDGVVRADTEVVADHEIRLKVSLAMEPQQSGPPVLLDLRFAFPFRRIDFGE
jgi:hypothetical protein